MKPHSRELIERRKARRANLSERPITVIDADWKLQDQVRFAGDRKYLLERLVRDKREICNRLRRNGYLKDEKRPLKTRGLGDHNKAAVRRLYHFILRSTGVVIGQHAHSMHLDGTISNQCYIQGNPSICSGVDYKYDVVFLNSEPNDDRPGEFNQVATIVSFGPFELRKAKNSERVTVPTK